MDTPSVQSLGLTLLLLYAHTVLWIELATEVLSPQLPWIKQSCPYPQKNSFTSVWGSSEKDLKIPVYGPNNENILLQVIYKDSPLWWERVGSWEGGFKKKKWKGKKERNMDLRSQWHRANQAGTTWKQTKSIVERLRQLGLTVILRPLEIWVHFLRQPWLDLPQHQDSAELYVMLQLRGCQYNSVFWEFSRFIGGNAVISEHLPQASTTPKVETPTLRAPAWPFHIPIITTTVKLTPVSTWNMHPLNYGGKKDISHTWETTTELYIESWLKNSLLKHWNGF